jgi:hypothetical protein
MAGKDALDSTTIERDVNPYSDLEVTIEGKTFGLVKEYMDEGLSKRRAEISGICYKKNSGCRRKS